MEQDQSHLGTYMGEIYLTVFGLGDVYAGRGRELRFEPQAIGKRLGVLIYVDQADPVMVPYLKGIHLTLDGWWGGRDEQGWKRARFEMEEILRNGDSEGIFACDNERASVLVNPVLRFEEDMKTLRTLTSVVSPPKRILCCYSGSGVWFRKCDCQWFC
jgi:hypothetical protein